VPNLAVLLCDIGLILVTSGVWRLSSGICCT